MKRLTIDIDPALHKRLKRKAADKETTIADVARKLLEQWESE
jgi:AmiR/NasT family two-component response regulator